MKTVQEGLNEAYKQAGQNAYFSEGFMAGAEFAQRWIPIGEEIPLAYKSGDWDGLKSDVVLAKNNHGSIFIAGTYQGEIDGLKYCDFVDMNEYVISNVISWRPIDVS